MHNAKKAEDCFSDIFKSMQMINFYILYYEYDFSKKQIGNFNKFMRKHNTEYDDGGRISQETEDKHLKYLGFDCFKEANAFPYRARRKMFDGKTKTMKDYQLFMINTGAAIETYLILAVQTLHENYRFSGAKLQEWWGKFLDFAMLYTEGLTDDHIALYFKQECDLDILAKG